MTNLYNVSHLDWNMKDAEHSGAIGDGLAPGSRAEPSAKEVTGAQAEKQ